MAVELHATAEPDLALGRRDDPVAVGIARRALDLTIGLLLMVLLAPLMLLIAIVIRAESPGAPVFRQRRLGRDLEPFTVNKFRTMRAGADDRPHQEYIEQLITQADAPEHDQKSGLYKLAVDDRITRVGRFLRRTSLDELPQLWNVVRGDMSLVGPRPVIEYELEHYPEWYLGRFAVKPGMTGLWQVSGRNERTYEEMVALDVDYACTRTLRMDLLILLKTIGVVLRRQGVA
jgi:lipopolysaccharide/colanic/teichoic acid biosynthesis glycosyltransferase